MTMTLNPTTCYDAVVRDEPQFDGQFFVAVLTTGIFCRPTCRSRTPRPENVLFFSTAAAAAEAGFRPCLVCRPESAPDMPEEEFASPLVRRAVQLVSQGFLDEQTVGDLARQLNLSQRHLRRLFLDELGAPPVAIAQTRRLLFAKKLIDETNLTMAEVAFSAGYSSVRRFNNAIRQTYGRTPSELRRRRRRSLSATDPSIIELLFFYREPYNWPAVLEFLRTHAVPLVEHVDEAGYHRSIRMGQLTGTLHVRPVPERRAVAVRVPSSMARFLLPITERVKQIFDLRADPVTIDAALSSDPLLAPIIRARPGMRVPGVWDAYELAVCSALNEDDGGRARQRTEAFIRAFGDEHRDPLAPSVTHHFPTPDRLIDVSGGAIDLPEYVAESIRQLSRDAGDERASLSTLLTEGEVLRRLSTLSGIGESTRRYIVMRMFRSTDAWSTTGTVTEDQPTFGAGEVAQARTDLPFTESRRHWSAYATMYRWLDSGVASLNLPPSQQDYLPESLDRFSRNVPIEM